MFLRPVLINVCCRNFRLYCTQKVVPSLKNQIVSKIKLSGPITVADYMKEVLTNPTAGYYMKKDVFGESGDFVTSPEVSQIFGELVSVWFLNELEKIGNPSPMQIIELGPGRGTLSYDILKVFRHFRKQEYKNISLHLVEISPFMSEMQAKTLNVNIDYEQYTNSKKRYYKSGVSKHGIHVYWYQRLQDVPNAFSIVVAHEFFDALPIHKLKKINQGWREILVDYDTTSDGLVFIISRNPTPVSQLYNADCMNEKLRNEIEVCPAASVLMQHLASRLEEDGGIALIADYGHNGEKGDTFRAFKNHDHHHPLQDPGTADLTADVDFSQLVTAGTKYGQLIAFGPITQQKFLKDLGIDVRLSMLLDTLTDEKEKSALQKSYNFMIDSDKMGERFKFVSFFPSCLKSHLSNFPVIGFT